MGFVALNGVGSILAPQDAPFAFAQEPVADDEHSPSVSDVRWCVLITDDDPEVHAATVFALRNVEIDGRALELLHAHSALEAEMILRTRSDVAVLMLDVVMETPDAGLTLVRTVRDSLGMSNIRIVLRTGQPGYAPELEVIRSFDINDYRTKSELTQTRLITTLTAAVRAYAQLEQIAAGHRGLAEVARASNALFAIHTAPEFARALLAELSNLLQLPDRGLVGLSARDDAAPEGGMQVLEASGPFAGFCGAQLEQVLEADMRRSVLNATAAQSICFGAGHFAMWIGSAGRDAVVVFEIERSLLDIERRLLEVFASNLAVGLANVDLFERLDFYAFFDPLTQLPNRTRFLSDVDRVLATRAAESLCLVIIDVVRFSDINDALGHRCGDALLASVAKRLRATICSSLMLARISGDAFAVFGEESVIDIRLVEKALEAPFFVQGHALQVQARFGMVQFAHSKGGAVDLLRNANLALNESRQNGVGAMSLFNRSMSEEVQNRVTLLHGLRAAIDFHRGLAVHFQPQLDARSGALVGMEALLRWRNDYGEMIPPDVFVPLAERTGMIHELGLWVLEVSLERLAKLQAQGYRDAVMSVNLSPVQLRAEDFAARAIALIELSDVPPQNLVLEITESVGLEDHVRVSAHLSALQALGVRLAIDDFGTGYSSLSQLARLPANILKIDRAFVNALNGQASARAVTATIVMLAQSRGLGLIAEGVETAEQVAELLEIGCEHMQGYYFARPMSAEQLESWLHEKQPTGVPKSS